MCVVMDRRRFWASTAVAVKKTEQAGDTRVAPELIFLFLEWINESLIRRMFRRFLRRAMIFAR
jgi:hypothetical protein